MNRNVLVTVLVASLLSACTDDWEGFVYPNKNDLTIHLSIGHHETLEECRAAVIAALQQMKSVTRGDYECGLNCKANKDLGGIKVCDETVK